jgi:molecular chaperone GrpE
VSDRDEQAPEVTEDPRRPDADVPDEGVLTPAPDDATTDAGALFGAGEILDASAGNGTPTTPVDTDPAEVAADAGLEDVRTAEELRAELAASATQRDEYLDDLRRARAEFENYRRRTGREAAAARDHGRGDVAMALVDVLDDLDRTVEAADGSADETLAKGVVLVADKLQRTLATQGIVRIAEVGAPFDPAVHEAVQQVAADPPTEDGPVVATILRPGYRLDERILRPAMVVVAD